MMRKSLIVLAVGAALIAAAFAASGTAQKSTITVGDFAVKVAKAIGRPAADQRTAVESLKAAGVSVGDASARLTEGMASRIMSDLGLRVTTTNPGLAVTPGKADQLAAVAGLASAASSSVAATQLPVECLQQRNRGQCDTCCTTKLGCDIDPTPCAGGVCAHFCHQVPPPGLASPSDPQP